LWKIIWQLLADLEDELLEAHRTLYIRNENYYDITVRQYSLDDFHAHS